MFKNITHPPLVLPMNSQILAFYEKTHSIHLVSKTKYKPIKKNKPIKILLPTSIFLKQVSISILNNLLICFHLKNKGSS